ncbi:hypothetical protein LMG29542_00133 [Paraburkholderia humisilvae]|uniref:Uncharacterized protein n=1 Tax=Paraburkholderia humisilvae TaxID=627669 RepID=A0A6J5D0E5_9BURK|nr:hypothetical protein LMG29542_00133 [Paraburkholderia humisilvae]
MKKRPLTLKQTTPKHVDVDPANAWHRYGT